MQLSAPTLPFDPIPSLPGSGTLPASLGQPSGQHGPTDFKSLLNSATEVPPAGDRPTVATVATLAADAATVIGGTPSQQTAGGMILSAANFQVAQPALAGAPTLPTLVSPAGRWITATAGMNQETSGAASLTNPKISGGSESNDQDPEPDVEAHSPVVPIGGADLSTMSLVIAPSAVTPAVSTATMQMVVASQDEATTSATRDGASDDASAGGAATLGGPQQNLARGGVPIGAAVARNPLFIASNGTPGQATAGRLPIKFASLPVTAANGDPTLASAIGTAPINGRSGSAKKMVDSPASLAPQSSPDITAVSFPGVPSTSFSPEVSTSVLSGLVTAPAPRGESQPTVPASVESSVRAATTFVASTGLVPGAAGDRPTSPQQVADVTAAPSGFEAPPLPTGAAKPDVANSIPRGEGTPVAPTESPQPAAINSVPVSADSSLIGPGVVVSHPQNVTLENFAGSSVRISEKSISVDKSAQKKSLVIDEESDVKRSTAVGINAAKSGIPMSVSAPSSSATSPVNEAPSFSVAPLSFEGLTKDSAATTPELDHTARRAVESAMAAVEHFTNSDQKSVNLQFTVSGVDLAVRVELRGENVHTTFRTDSPELRNALANEWQAVNNGPTGDGTHRFADPVFMTPSGTASTGSDFGAASQQRQSGSRQNQPLPPEFSVFRNTSLSPDNSTESAAAKSPLILPASTSRRLNTFA
jgi:hypothetical protein